ncbi:tyrosine-protein phosphatase [Listeria ilorinensis]|uniref:tyrosine-protein phosphatase n=1 Tax=Listeria ilorinensis TaxID=2867439 RepID=UPI001EF4E0FD|nr:tyrosine-protein phosphatase [Listeria ilorinensis]
MKITRENDHFQLSWENELFQGTVTIYQSSQADCHEKNKLAAFPAEQKKAQLPLADAPVYFLLQDEVGLKKMAAERILPFQGTFNFRDMGGYENKAGRRVKWGKLFRSGSLAGITAADRKLILDLGIRWICDLRSSSEIAAQPTPEISGVQNKHIPIGTAKNETPDIDLGDKTIYEPLMGESYRVFAGSTDGFKQIFDELLDQTESGVPFLFHCTAGKDRTGVLGALLLKILDVPDETIFADYAITNLYADEILQEMGGLAKMFGAENVTLEDFRPMAEARPAYLKVAFSEMEKNYGSVSAYLEKGVGITPDMKQKLQALLLD